MSIVVTNVANAADLAVLIAAMGRLNGCKVHLYQNNVVPSPTTLLTDFTECTFGGYAASTAIVFGTVQTDALGAVTYGDAKTFVATDAASPQLAYGYYVTNTGGTVLQYSEAFASPIPFGVAGDFGVIVPVYRQGQLAAIF